MNKSTLISGIVGGIVSNILGYLFYGMAGIMDGHMSDAGATIMRADADMNMPLLVVGNLVIGLTLAMIYGKWARGYHGFGSGFQLGALIGVLTGFGLGLIWHATSDLMTMTGHIIDGVWQVVSFGIVGGVIAVLYDKFDNKD